MNVHQALDPYETIQADYQDGWVRLWLNRPEQRNAMSALMVDELSRLFQAVPVMSGLRGLVLSGRGGQFSAGGDLKGFSSAAGADHAVIRERIIRDNQRGGAMIEQLHRLPCPVVAVVEGAAIAGGLGLVCASDIVIAAPDARFAVSETRLGLAPAQIAPYVARRTGWSIARRLMLTGMRFDADEAWRLGIVHHVAPEAGDVEHLLSDIVRQINRCAPGANAATKRLLQEAEGQPISAFQNHAAEVFADLLLGDEAREGLAAFAERRAPSWCKEGAGEQ